MSKRILLIDSDESFNAGLVSAITARGFTATAATDSEQGMSLAKEETPDLIVVCVEAQPTNGYMLCTRLKKDEQLKGVPVILTSANATADAFEKHKKLKTRAEEYLIKPFEPQTILEKASALLGVELPAEGEEEVVAVEDDSLSLDELSTTSEDQPISLSEEDAAEARSGVAEESLEVAEVEEIEEVEVEEDAPAAEDDLDVFDKAFDSLGGGSGPAPETTARFSDVQPSAAPAHEELKADKKEPTELSAPDDDAVLHSLESGSELSLDEEPKPVARPPARGVPEPKVKPAPVAKTADADKARLEEEIRKLKDEAQKRETANKALQQRADALAAAAKKFERELTAAREEAKKSGRSAQLEKQVAELEAEVNELREQVATLTGEKEVLAESRDESRKQLEEAQAAAEQNEDRAVKAYGRIKAEEKLREKARKALQIALQLLEETGDDDDESPSKKLA